VSEYESPKQNSALYFGDRAELAYGKAETKRMHRDRIISPGLGEEIRKRDTLSEFELGTPQHVCPL
jgi:hypothetical protein